MKSDQESIETAENETLPEYQKKLEEAEDEGWYGQIVILTEQAEVLEGGACGGTGKIANRAEAVLRFFLRRAII